ncbi:MAG: 4-hydroxy-3-methylbut-2-enyl diphosphate reductase [Chloroflexota bacterium]
MALEIEKATGTGFCFGVRRAVDLLEKVSVAGSIETLGAVVHNRPVLQRLAKIGITVAEGMDEIKGNRVAISSHGVSPEVEKKLRARCPLVVDTTCPFVHRAQIAARRLAEAGYFTVIYGDATHPEIKSVLGWAKGQGIATLDVQSVTGMGNIPRRLGILSQTTQIPEQFNVFVKKLIDSVLGKDSELRIIDTICHDIRERQEAALNLARRVDLMLVIGGHSSANTHHLVDLCSEATKTYLVETADEIKTSWFEGRPHVGIASGASTDEETINEVQQKLKSLAF